MENFVCVINLPDSWGVIKKNLNWWTELDSIPN
jgi:hypothetical protein